MGKRRGGRRVPRRSYVRSLRRRFSRPKGVPIGLLGGALVGPAAIALGTGSYPGPIWSVSPSLMGQEAIDRLSIAYTGYKVSDGSHFTLNQGGGIGTVALVVGLVAHKAAAMFGLNRELSKYRWTRWLKV